MIAAEDEDARASNAHLVDELKDQLQRAETASEQYQKQLEVLQLRLDEVTKDHFALEERVHEQDGNISLMQIEAKDHARQKREMEVSMESERNLLAKEKEEHITKEEELQSVIQRLNENLKQREVPRAISRSCTWYFLLQKTHTNLCEQRASATGLQHPQIWITANLLLRQVLRGVPQETIPSCYYKKTR